MFDIPGVELDTSMMMARLPEDKLQRYGSGIKSLLEAKKATLRELRSIIGQLQYSTCVITSGKAFLRRLINITIGRSVPHYFIKLSKEVLADLEMWAMFLENYNGKSFLYAPSLVTSQVINLYTDSSKLGYGAIYGSNWIQGKWNSKWSAFNIAVLEMYPLVALAYTFGHKLKNSVILFHCDNIAVVEIVNKLSSKDEKIMCLVRLLVLKLLQYNITFKAQHISGVKNILADAVSRFQETPQMLANYKMAARPMQVPKEILPENIIMG